MDRRKLFGTAFCALLAVPASTIAPRSTKVWRIGFLVVSGAGDSGASPSNVPSAALRQALQELGYVEGKNIVYVAKSAGGNVERLPAAAAELVGLDVDVIITTGSESTRAAKQATTSIPIVFLGPSYPVEEQIVSSLARPGANVTGITLAQSDHASKHLQLLRDLVPSLKDVAVVWSPNNQGSVFTLRDIEGAARPLRIRIHSLPISPADERDAVLTAIDRLRPGALIMLPSQLVMPRVQRISEQAVRLRRPHPERSPPFGASR